MLITTAAVALAIFIVLVAIFMLLSNIKLLRNILPASMVTRMEKWMGRAAEAAPVAALRGNQDIENLTDEDQYKEGSMLMWVTLLYPPGVPRPQVPEQNGQ